MCSIQKIIMILADNEKNGILAGKIFNVIFSSLITMEKNGNIQRPRADGKKYSILIFCRHDTYRYIYTFLHLRHGH